MKFHSDASADPSIHSLSQLLQRMAVPLVVFSGVFLLLLILSWFLLLPRFTMVEVGGVERSARSLKGYLNELQAQVAVAEQARDEAVLPHEHEAYLALLTQKMDRTEFSQVGAAVEQAGKGLVPGKDRVVMLARIHFHPSQAEVELIGDVRNVGTQSMTVLAQYVEVLRDLPFVEEVSRPRFEKREHETIGLYSPFRLTLTLK